MGKLLLLKTATPANRSALIDEAGDIKLKPQSHEGARMRVPIRPALPRSIWKQPAAPRPEPVWQPGPCAVLARKDCRKCLGGGMTLRAAPCICALRAIFRACFRKYCYIQSIRQMSHSKLDRIDEFHAGDHISRCVFGRKDEEFAADFWIIAGRTLDPLCTGSRLWQIFELHFLGGLAGRACARLLGINQGEFFCEVYRIQSRCGRAFYETRPYAIYPIYEYFGGTTRRAVGKADNRDNPASCPDQLRAAA